MAPRVKKEMSNDSLGLAESSTRKKRKNKRSRKKKRRIKNDDENGCEALKVSRAALRYKPSKRMIEISTRAAITLTPECKAMLERTQDLDLSNPTNKTIRLLTKKEFRCPDLLTAEERNILWTPGGIRRTALKYKFTRRMEYLSVPAWKFLKDRKDEEAKRLKEFILKENDIRGRQAWIEKMKRADKKKRREEEKKKPKEEKGKEERTAKSEEEETQDVAKEPAHDEGDEEKLEKGDDEAAIPGEKRESKEDDSKIASSQELDWHEDEEAIKRRAARNAWRFAPPPCKKNPFGIKKSALRGKISPRMAELAIRTLPKALTPKKNPFGVKKSALKGPVSPRYDVLAIPNHPRDPIEKPPPREKDSFGRPIYEKPVYGRKIPNIRPIPPAKCFDKEKKAEEEAKKKGIKRKHIDPIVYEATIDPCIYPDRAKRQMKARKAAKEEFKRRREAEAENQDQSAPKTEETTNEPAQEKPNE
ncbi:uncharacterized protein [Venturia canescens]|uniref:uncharacterized protein n=1 Tax=Venturia canescens TaxID=32260 RepID=UPI001C9CF1F2|nr:uncharacterized protein LOC122407137 [Venturia canescens]